MDFFFNIRKILSILFLSFGILLRRLLVEGILRFLKLVDDSMLRVFIMCKVDVFSMLERVLLGVFIVRFGLLFGLWMFLLSRVCFSFKGIVSLCRIRLFILI